MKVAVITQSVGHGGVASVVNWLKRGLTGLGLDVDVHVLASSRRDPLSRRLVGPATWRTLPSSARGTGATLWGSNWVEFEPMRYLPRGSLTNALSAYDVVQVVAGTPALALAVEDCPVPRLLQVATTMSWERPPRLADRGAVARLAGHALLPVLNRMDRRGALSVDHVVVENDAMWRWVLGQGQANVSAIPPGIDMERFVPAKRWPREAPILAFGRLGEERKDWPTAVAAYEEFIANTGARNTLTLAGAGPMPDRLRQRVALSPVVDRIRILQDIPDDDLPLLMASSSVFLQSSREEGLGIAGLEAMAAGLPVVATSTVGSLEYVKCGHNGFLAALGEGTVSALARGLQRVLAEGSLGSQLSTSARQTALEGYSSDQQVRRFVDLYRAVARRR